MSFKKKPSQTKDTPKSPAGMLGIPKMLLNYRPLTLAILLTPIKHSGLPATWCIVK